MDPDAAGGGISSREWMRMVEKMIGSGLAKADPTLSNVIRNINFGNYKVLENWLERIDRRDTAKHPLAKLLLETADIEGVTITVHQKPIEGLTRLRLSWEAAKLKARDKKRAEGDQEEPEEADGIEDDIDDLVEIANTDMKKELSKIELELKDEEDKYKLLQDAARKAKEKRDQSQDN